MLYDSDIFLALCFLAFFAVIKYLHHTSAKQYLTDFPRGIQLQMEEMLYAMKGFQLSKDGV